MASYNGLAESENICKTNIDNQKILKDLEELETTITYLKSYPPSELSDEIQTKIHVLVTSFQVLQARLFRSRIVSNAMDELWEGFGMLKYLFEKCIQHYELNNRLKCNTCDEWLQVCRVDLKNHLESSQHVRSFSEKMHSDMLSYWKDIIRNPTPTEGEVQEDLNIDDDKCLMLKYGRFIDFDGPNDMLFCKLCCVLIQKNDAHLKTHFKQSLHQEHFKDAVNVIVGRSKNNAAKTKNKNIFIDTDSSIPAPILNFNNLQQMVNNNMELGDNLSFQSTNENREEMVSWYKDTIDKFIVEVLRDEVNCGKVYICCICQLRTTSFKKWQVHCFSVGHETRMKLFNNVSYYPCDCSTEMICPNYIRQYHMQKIHQQLLDFFNGLKSQLSDDDNASSNDDNNSGIEEEIKSKSKISNTGAKPKIVNGNNETGVGKKGVPPKSTAKKPARRTEENGNSAQNSNATPIGLSDVPDNASDDDLKRAIQHFGNIDRIERVQSSFANVFIELREEFQSILYLGLTVSVKGSVVKITDPILKSTSGSAANVGQSSLPTVDVQLPRAISSSLQNEQSFKELLYELKSAADFGLNSSMNETSNCVKLVLLCPVLIVGSKALNLAFDGDYTLDLFVEIDDNYFGKKTELTAVELSPRTIKLFNGLKQSGYFKDVEIVGDNVQTLRLKHIGTGQKCQIFCRDGLIVEKANLSRLYVECDHQIRPMMLALLKWFKVNNLRNVLSTYSILWMALFPLMTKSYLDPVIVSRNQNDSGRKMISGWDCRFSSEFNPKMRELPEPYELVKIFFEFYSEPRNFERKVLAPLTAEAFDQQRVRQKKLPPAYGRYCHLISTKSVRFFKLTNGLCLMDPLQLNFNLTKSLQGNSLSKFVALCKETLKCFNP